MRPPCQHFAKRYRASKYGKAAMSEALVAVCRDEPDKDRLMFVALPELPAWKD
jgi:hypothetical protein